MVYKKLDHEVRFAKVSSKTSINKIPIKEHIICFVHSIRYYVTAGKVFLATVVVDPSNKLIMVMGNRDQKGK